MRDSKRPPSPKRRNPLGTFACRAAREPRRVRLPPAVREPRRPDSGRSRGAAAAPDRLSGRLPEFPERSQPDYAASEWMALHLLHTIAFFFRISSHPSRPPTKLPMIISIENTPAIPAPIAVPA